LTAPDAQVISVKLMSDNGTLSDDDLASALDWLTQYIADGYVVDVVLMAFGRPKEPGEDNPASLVRQFGELGRKGVTIVASAGNAGVDTETIPACLAADPCCRSSASARAPRPRTASITATTGPGSASGGPAP
jgi:subtilisin family serine protease